MESHQQRNESKANKKSMNCLFYKKYGPIYQYAKFSPPLISIYYVSVFKKLLKRKRTRGKAYVITFYSRTDENISIYERKILRFIFGGIRVNGTWRRRTKLQLYQSYKESDIVHENTKWSGHVIKMSEDRTTKKVFNAQPIGTQRKGRWIDGLEKDFLILRTRNWRKLTRRRLAWKRLLDKAHPGLSSHSRRPFTSN
ncbi:uncharacterized protein TNCV_2859171 [Trichonephila clavipes]|nr:uncharacterized protein TNCV_2859171 [Trichonephila clavipes]